MLKKVLFFGLFFGFMAPTFTSAAPVEAIRTAVYRAAARGDSAAVQALKRQGYNLDTPNDRGHTVLCEAVRRGDYRAVQTLISAGADTGATCMQTIPVAEQQAVGLKPMTTESKVQYVRSGQSITAAGASSGIGAGTVVGIGVGAAALVGGALIASGGGGGGGDGHGSSAATACSGNDCGPHGTCNTEKGTCDCRDGYFGTRCERAPNTEACAQVNCGPGGTCNEQTGQCICETNYTAQNNTCMCTADFNLTECPEGGICTACTDLSGTRHKLTGCRTPYTMKDGQCVEQAQCGPEFRLSQCPEFGVCNRCSDTTGVHYALTKCIDNEKYKLEGDTCVKLIFCSADYSLTSCPATADKCKTCEDSKGIHYQVDTCQKNYSGRQCETYTKPSCRKSEYLSGEDCLPCGDGAVSDGGQATTCTCKLSTQTWSAGSGCTYKEDTCQVKGCQNNGTCQTGGLCSCPSGYSGNYCETGPDCPANSYLSGNSCLSCGRGGTSPGGQATTCTCTSTNQEWQNGKCVAKPVSCTTTQYYDNGTCKSCGTGATSAGGQATTCTCADENQEWSNGRCVNKPGVCAKNQYLVGDTCKPCGTGATSPGGTSATCTCTNTNQEWQNGKCVAKLVSCTTTQYYDNGTCKSCGTGATSAGGQATTCTCSDTQKIWQNGLCVAKPAGCTTSQYYDNGTCKPCGTGAWSLGGNATSCVCTENNQKWQDGTCQANSNLSDLCGNEAYYDVGSCTCIDNSKIWVNGQCVADITTCPANYYDTSDPGIGPTTCLPCGPGAVSDASNAHACRCTDSSKTWRWGGIGCVDTICSNTQYYDNGTCKSCGDGAFSLGGQATGCFCSDENQEWSNGQCVNKPGRCSTTQYYDNGTCKSCGTGATSAGGQAATCTCSDSNQVWQDGACITQQVNCTTGQYYDNGTCVSCGTGATSAGGQDTVCVCDDEDLEWVNGACITPPNCTTGQYYDKGTCKSCGDGAFSEGGQATTCTCFDVGQVWQNGACVASSVNCTTRQYFNDGTCLPCGNGATSAGGQATACTCTDSSKVWKNGECVVRTVNCTTSQYYDGSACVSCGTGATSAGGKDTGCTCTDTTKVWQDGQCIASSVNCTTDQYYDRDYDVCEPCGNGAVSTGGHATTCRCTVSTRTWANGRCTSGMDCGDHAYEDNGTCLCQTGYQGNPPTTACTPIPAPAKSGDYVGLKSVSKTNKKYTNTTKYQNIYGLKTDTNLLNYNEIKEEGQNGVINNAKLVLNNDTPFMSENHMYGIYSTAAQTDVYYKRFDRSFGLGAVINADEANIRDGYVSNTTHTSSGIITIKDHIGTGRIAGIWATREPAINAIARHHKLARASGTITLTTYGTGDGGNVIGIQGAGAINAVAARGANAIGNITITNRRQNNKVYGIHSTLTDSMLLVNLNNVHNLFDGLPSIINTKTGLTTQDIIATTIRGRFVSGTASVSAFNAGVAYDKTCAECAAKPGVNAKIRINQKGNGEAIGISSANSAANVMLYYWDADKQSKITGQIAIYNSGNGSAYGMKAADWATSVLLPPVEFKNSTLQSTLTSKIILKNTKLGTATGIYAANAANTGGVRNGKTITSSISITNSKSGTMVGMNATKTALNSGTITLTGADSTGLAYGIKVGPKATVTNSGTITITDVDTGYGIYADGTGGTITNSGTIDVSANKAYGIFVKNGTNTTVVNKGTITLNGTTCTNCTGTIKKDVGDYIVLHGATLENAGTLSARLLDFDTLDGRVKAAQGSIFAADHIRGNLSLSSDIVADGFEARYVAPDMILANKTDGLNLISESVLFRASLADNGRDTVLERRAFSEVIGNQSLAAFLEQNYALHNNEAFYRDLKSIGSLASLNRAVNTLNGRDNLMRFSREDRIVVREMNRQINQDLFAAANGNITEKTGSVNSFSFQNDSGSYGQYALGLRRINPHLKVGYAMMTARLNTQDRAQDNNRNGLLYQLALPMNYRYGSLAVMMTPTIGFIRNHYNRVGPNDTTQRGILEKRVFAWMNEARYPLTIREITLAPTMELNILMMHQKGDETHTPYALVIPDNRQVSLEGGLGFNLAHSFIPHRGTKLNLTARIMGYYEFLDPYQMRVGIQGMSGTFDLMEEHQNWRTETAFKVDYEIGDTSIWGQIRHFTDTDTRTDVKAGIKWGF